MPRRFNPEGVPAPQFYSHGAEVAAGQRLVFVSGQVGVGPDGQPAEGIEAQTKMAVQNLKGVLAAADMTLDDVAKYTFFLTDPMDAQGFAQGAVEMLQDPPAAVTMIFVSALAAPNLKVEIECVAAK